MKKLILSTAVISSCFVLSACGGDSLPKVCENYISETESLMKLIPAEQRAQLEPQLKTELENMRKALKEMSKAQQESECQKALDMLAMIKNMMPK